MDPAWTIVGIGMCYIDTILTVSHFPLEDEKLRANSLQIRRGGNVPNTFEVLDQLIRNSSSTSASTSTPPDSTKLVLLSVLPALDSPATRQILDSFGPSVSCDSCIYREHRQHAPSSYIIRNRDADSRTIINHNDLDEMTAGECASRIGQLNVTERTLYHFEGRIPETTLQCMRHIRRHHAAASVSVELEKPNREGLDALAAEADVVFHSRSWAEGRGFTNPGECLLARAKVCKKAGYLFCTWGKEGAAALRVKGAGAAPSPEDVVHVAAPTVNVVDPVGAGDTFIAGVLYQLICRAPAATPWASGDLERTLRFANTLAGRKVGQEGLRGLVGAPDGAS